MLEDSVFTGQKTNDCVLTSRNAIGFGAREKLDVEVTDGKSKLVLILQAQPNTVRQSGLDGHGDADFHRLTMIFDHLQRRKSSCNFRKNISRDDFSISRIHAVYLRLLAILRLALRFS